MELCLGFHIGFVGKFMTRKKLVMDGKAVAWYYVRRGQFFVDTLTAVAWSAQVCSHTNPTLFMNNCLDCAQISMGIT